MKKTFTVLVAFTAGMMILMLVPSRQPPAPMPWQITIMPDGHPQVLGIHLGVTTYWQAQRLLRQSSQTAIFTEQGHKPTVEAYFDSVHLGGLSAKLVLNFDASSKLISAMIGRATQSRLEPSGARRYTLSHDDNKHLADAVVAAITYIPSIRLNPSIIRQRFGNPDYIDNDKQAENGESWHYPDLGLTVYFITGEKTVLQYEQSG